MLTNRYAWLVLTLSLVQVQMAVAEDPALRDARRIASMRRSAPKGPYTLGPGDVLGIHIDGVLGDSTNPIPVHFPKNGEAPSMGYPVPVREDGTIFLPLIPPLKATGLSLIEIEEAIRHALVDEHKILKAGKERILITMMHRRTVRVMVVREDTTATNPQDPKSATRRGAVTTVELKPGENDVLHALAGSGGLPGNDAKRQVTVMRSAEQSSPVNKAELRDGDIVRIEGRSGEVFYSGGLLPGSEHLLPRDRELSISQAVAIAGGVPRSSLRGIPPSRVIVVRRLPDGGQMLMQADLAHLDDPRLRNSMAPGDVLMLEYRPRQIFFNFALEQLSQGLLLNAIGR